MKSNKLLFYIDRHKLIWLRRIRGWSQKEAAFKCKEISLRQYARYERGEQKTITIKKLRAITSGFGVDVWEVLTDDIPNLIKLGHRGSKIYKYFTRNEQHVREWQEVSKESHKFLAFSYIHESEWYRPGVQYIFEIHRKRIESGANFKRVFVLDNENEKILKEKIMLKSFKSQVETRWILTKDLFNCEVTKNKANGLGRCGFHLSNDLWIGKASLDNYKKFAGADLSTDNKSMAIAQSLFWEAFRKGHEYKTS